MNVKRAVLKRLEENRGGYLSGERIAAELGVSRQAVSKAVSSLKSEGYSVLAVNNKGYMLDNACDRLSADIISDRTGAKCLVFETCGSTNNEALREYLSNGECIVVARGQTGGRKKDGTNFYSPCDKGIYFSIALPLSIPVAELEKLRDMCGATVCGVISSVCGKTAYTINRDEIYIDGKKVCGILIECSLNAVTLTTECAVIGIGVYTSETCFADTALASVFPEDTRNNIISEIYLKIKESI